MFKDKQTYIDGYDEAEIAAEAEPDVKEEGEDEEPWFSQEALEEIFGVDENEVKPSVPITDSKDIEDYNVSPSLSLHIPFTLTNISQLFEPEATPSRITPTALLLLRPKSRPGSSSLFAKPRKPSNAPISRVMAPMGLVDPKEATSISLIKPEEAMMAEAVDIAGKKSKR
jgi:hypothetical protein